MGWRFDFRPERQQIRRMNLGTFFFAVYVSVTVGVGLYLLSLLGRLVKAHERIAGALERNSGSRAGD